MALKGIAAVLRRQLSQAVPQLTIKGQKFTVVDGEHKVAVSSHMRDGNKEYTYVRVIFVNAASHIGKIYYEGAYKEGEDEVPPTCFSEDGVIPAAAASEKQCESCALCPHNAFNTAVTAKGTGKGKACRDIFKTAVLVPEYSMDVPLLLRIPPASLKNFLGYAQRFEVLSTPEKEGQISDRACIVYFDPDAQGILNFEADDFNNDKEAFAHLKHERETEYLIGTHHVQVPAVEQAAPPARLEHKPEPRRDAPQQEAAQPEKRGRGRPRLQRQEEPARHREDVPAEPAPEEPTGSRFMRGRTVGDQGETETAPSKARIIGRTGSPSNGHDELKSSLAKAMGIKA
jgi:hypothetical protein